jgi:hypothetical protein
MIWVFASVTSDHLVRSTPILASIITTGLVYLVGYRMFDLGRRPGEPPGQTT